MTSQVIPSRKGRRDLLWLRLYFTNREKQPKTPLANSSRSRAKKIGDRFYVLSGHGTKTPLHPRRRGPGRGHLPDHPQPLPPPAQSGAQRHRRRRPRTRPAALRSPLLRLFPSSPITSTSCSTSTTSASSPASWRYLNSNLAREVGRLYGWEDKIWSRRYQAIIVSGEEGAQTARLKYVLANGCKEDLVARPQDWPGVHAARALVAGEALTGTWFDRTQEYAARRRGEDFDRLKYATTETLHLSPLPCWKDLPAEAWKERTLHLIQEIEEEAAVRRSRTGSQPLGAAAIRGQHPHDRPKRPKKSPAPLFHAGELQGAPGALGSVRLVRRGLPGRGGEAASGRSPRGVSRSGASLRPCPSWEGSFSPGLADHRLWSELLEEAGAKCVPRAVSVEGNLSKIDDSACSWLLRRGGLPLQESPR